MQAPPPLTGFQAIEHALGKMDKNVLKSRAQADLKQGKKTHRAPAIKLLQVIEGLDRNELEPADLMISKVPVIPPLYRPFAVVGDTFLPGPSNELYRDLIQYRDFHDTLSGELGEEGTRDTKYNLYKAIKSVYGYDEAINPKTKSRGVSGFLEQLLGDGSPKKSVFHKRLFSKTQDSISRGVVTAGPDLEIDEIGIPKEMAWKMYGPYIQRRLLRSGMSSMGALQHVADRSPHAEKALHTEMGERPVIYSRAPAWHKYNVLSGWPRLTDGDDIQTNPYVSTGLSLDHDGDMQVAYIRLLRRIK
jgi:DNA-directed RNA polymerase beta' subunit